MRAYVGVDWSATEVVAAVADEHGNPAVLPGRVRPTVDDVRRLVHRARQTVGADEVFVMIEAGADIWVRLFACSSASVFVVDPKQARRFAESISSSGAKDDRRDARALARMCRSREHRGAPWRQEEEAIEQLDTLAGLNEQLTKDLVRVKQRLRQTLRELAPLLDQALPQELCTRWVERLLRRAPTPWHARDLTRVEFDELLRSARASTRDRVWEALQQSHAPWLTQGSAEAIAGSVRVHLDQLVLLRDQLASVRERLDEVSAPIEGRELAESIDGVGLKLSTVLILYVFRYGCTSSRDEAAVLMGAAPVFRGSAKMTRGSAKGQPKGRTSMRRSAPSRARRATFLLGQQAAQRLKWARAMYADGRARGQTAGTAYRRITRSLLRILTAMLRDRQPYDEERYIEALKTKGVAWAAAL